MKKRDGFYHGLFRRAGRRVGALALTVVMLAGSLSDGSVYAAAVTESETSDAQEDMVEMNDLKQADYTDAGTDQFAIGETKTFTFGSGGTVKAATAYSTSRGYGWESTTNVTLKNGTDYVAGTNYLSTANSITTWEYPTFVLDVPVGIYDVTIIQGTNGSEDAVNGAYVEGNMYSVRWSTESFSTSYTMPSESSWIYTKAGEEQESTVETAVADGQLTIEFATSLTDDNVSGTTYIKEVRVTRVEQITDASESPTLRFIGDSTLAKYPPEDGQVWTPIPERTGWGEEFSMGKFVDDSVVLVNKAVAGSSIKSYIYDGYLNDFLLTSHPGDTVIVEGGINDSATGRRYSTADEYEETLRYYVDALQAFGLDVIISSGTSSSTTYTTPMQTVANDYDLHYVDLLGDWSAYTTALKLTVDGTHLNRVGGILAAQMVAADIKDLTGLSISGHILDVPVNTEAPTATVSNLRVKKQGSGFISLQWDIEESVIYDENQLIGNFIIYRVETGSSDEAEAVYTQTATLSAGMTEPQTYATFEAPETGDYTYYVTVQGATGEGPASDSIDVAAYEPTDADELQELIDQYDTQLFDASVYTVETYAALRVELDAAKELLEDSSVTMEQITAELEQVNAAIEKLEQNATTLVETTFEDEALTTAPWGVSGGNNTLLSATMDTEGNRLLRLYVEAAGSRTVYKSFSNASAISADTEMVEFLWYPGKPDTRNCTEVEFYSGSSRVLSLKSACMDAATGHVGYVVGDYPSDNRYLIGTGFHDYEDSTAVDLGLDSEAWYQVRIVFNFADGTADLYLVPCEGDASEGAVVEGIELSTTGSTITKMNFLLMRGRTDGDAGNDLSILWDTRLDDFGIYYITEPDTVSTADYLAAVEAYQTKIAGLGSTVLSADTFVLADAVIDIMEQDVGFYTEEDYTYATSVILAATEAAPTLQNATAISLSADSETVYAGETVAVTATLNPTDTNEEILYTSSDESIAVVTGSAENATVTAKCAGTVTITATGENSGVSGSIELTVTGQAYFFGTDTANAYDEATGYGFMDYSYPNEAAGWQEVYDSYHESTKSVYSARELTEEAGTSYVDTSASGEDYLAISGQVWTELPSGGRDEDKLTYENTNAFVVDLPNGNYTVTVNFTNPDDTSMDVMVKTEDIRRYSAGDHDTSEIAEATVAAGADASVSFDIALTDGQLTLRFEQNSVASETPTDASDVYVKSVLIHEIDSKSADADKVTIYTIGDSTVQSYYTDGYRRSWAQYLYTLFGELNTETAIENATGYDFMETDNVIFRNYARDARSTKSFLEEGRLNEVLLNVNEGDYVLMQFAHNDDNQDRTNRYVDVDEFKNKISEYNQALAERGATLVLVTPITIEAWNDDGTIDHRFDDYRLAMLQQAAEEEIPVLDLMGSTIALVDAMGSENTTALSLYKDTVHTLESGAHLFTALIGNLLQASTDEKLAAMQALMNVEETDEYISVDCADILLLEEEYNLTSTDVTVTSNASETTIYVSDENVVKYENGTLTAVGAGSAIVTAAYTVGDLTTTDCTAYTAYKVVTVKNASDLTALSAAITAAKNVTEASYTTASYAAVTEALAAAEALSVTDDQTTIDAATEALTAAIAALVARADRTELAKAIAAAEAVTEADYTADSYAKVTEVLKAAKALDADASQEDVDAAATALNQAVAALVKAETGSSETQTEASETEASETVTEEPEEGATLSKGSNSYTVTSQGEEVSYAGTNNKKATSVTIPATVEIDGITYKVTAIEKNAFAKNTTLKKVTIGKNVETIGTSAFAGCTKLTTVKFGSNSKCATIGNKAFYGDKALKTITLPNSVTKIGTSAFASCTKLQSITIGTGLKSIGKQAFSGDKKLAKITIKSTKLTKVGTNALKGTKKNITIKVPKKKVSAYKKLFNGKGQSKYKVTN